MRKSATAALLAPLFIFSATVAQGAAPAAPFSYPASALVVPATLAEPPALVVHAGGMELHVGADGLVRAAGRLGVVPVREGTGDYARSHACAAVVPSRGRAAVLWLIATGGDVITEAQLEWRPEAPAVCARLPEGTVLRLGRAELGMDAEEALERLGTPSHEDAFGWRFWLSQQFTKNARGLEGLELDWLGLHQDGTGRVDRLFTSFVRNP